MVTVVSPLRRRVSIRRWTAAAFCASSAASLASAPATAGSPFEPRRTVASESASAEAFRTLTLNHAGKTTDIVLASGNTLSGRFVDAGGQPIDGAVVSLMQDNRGIARTTTDRNGVFSVSDVAAGTYRLTCGSAAGSVRCWPSDAAPPNAVDGDLTFQDGLVRGQAALLIPAMSTGTLVSSAAATGAVVSGVAVSGLTASGSTGDGSREGSSGGTDNGGGGGTTLQPPAGRPENLARMARLSNLNSQSPNFEYRELNGKLIRVPRPPRGSNSGPGGLQIHDPFASEYWSGEEFAPPASP